ncbi:MAG: HAD-IIIA family hydrolase, partial [Candidatus Electrothrix sp. MAN1_4]|nr:HAD-IIIA family hydrolase [Candidatus Electrothrix sp. MAN1_4]
GLARGYFPPSLLDEVHTKMEQELQAEGAHIDGLYICPHHPEAKEEQFRKACDCRKPGTGLLKQAAAELDLDLSRSFMVGDRWSDVKCGIQVGATSILVLTGYGRGDLKYIGPQQVLQPDKIAEDVSAAVEWIVGQVRNSNG